jgi:hypothetical protein
MHNEQRQRQQARYARSLLDAVYEPERIRRQQITDTRRRNQIIRQQKEQQRCK